MLTFGIQNGLELYNVPMVKELQVADLPEGSDRKLHEVEASKSYSIFLIDHVEFLERDELPVPRGWVDTLALVDLPA